MNLYLLLISEFYWLHLAHYYQFLNISLRQIVGLKPTSQFSLLRNFHVHEIEEQAAVLVHVAKKNLIPAVRCRNIFKIPYTPHICVISCIF